MRSQHRHSEGEAAGAHQPSLQRDGVDVEVFDQAQVVVHVLQTAQHLQHNTRITPLMHCNYTINAHTVITTLMHNTVITPLLQNTVITPLIHRYHTVNTLLLSHQLYTVVLTT